MTRLSGAHRIKRVPPSEKKGRRHTSTIMVIAAETAATAELRIGKHEVREEFLRTSGKGGQRRNKVATAVRLTHIPTGTSVVADGEREQGKNRDAAWTRLQEKLNAEAAQQQRAVQDQAKADQFKLDNAWSWTDYADEVRTPSGARASMKRTLRGDFSKLLS